MTLDFRKLCLAFIFVVVQNISPVWGDTGETLLWPEHAEAIRDAESELREAAGSFLNGNTREAASEILALLDTPRISIQERFSLVGPCRVRSLQVSVYGATAYGFFPCTLRREAAKGLIFQKDAGSQRRFGLFLDSEKDKKRLVFVGGRYHADEPPRHYSRFDAAEGDDIGTDVDKSSDSIGMVYLIGPNRFLIVFAPIMGRREIYEVIRS